MSGKEQVDWSSILEYDATVPSRLRTKTQRGPKRTGEAVGWQREDGYWLIGYAGKNYLAHRVIYEMFNGPIEDGMQVDHIDGNTANNSPDNLRAVAPAINQRNMKKSRANSSGTTGVSRIEVMGRKDKTFVYWVATWKDENNKQANKYYSVLKYGEDIAKELAIARRAEAIDYLNKLGMDYSERHGNDS